MPHELRRLYFSDDEVLQALIAFNAQAKRKFLPPGSLVGMILPETPHAGVELRIEAIDGTIKTHHLGDALVGAAIIRFCMNLGVPLPQQAIKSLRVRNGRIALDVTLGQEPEAATAPILDEPTKAG